MVLLSVALVENRYDLVSGLLVVICLRRPPAPLAYASAAEPGLLDCLAVFGLALWGQDSSLNRSVWSSSASIRFAAIAQ